MKKEVKTENGWLFIPSINKEVEINVHDKNTSYDDNVKKYGKDFESMLLTKAECELILKDPEVSKLLKMDGSSDNDDFFIKQYSDLSRRNGYVAGFYSDSNGSSLDSRINPDDSYSDRGIRFVRKISKKNSV